MDGLIQDLHYLIKLKVQKLDSNTKGDLVPAAIDTLINNQLGVYVDIFFSGNQQASAMGFETTQQRTDMLLDFLVVNPEQPSLIAQKVNDFKYEIKLNSLNHKYRHLIRATLNTDCGVVNLNLAKHMTLNTILNDEFSKASKAWKRIPISLSRSSDGEGKSIYFHTGDSISISEVDIEYIKQPNEVFFGGYDTMKYLMTGTGFTKNDEPVHPELSSNYFEVLADLVVQEWERSQLLDVNVSKDAIVSKT